MFRIKDAYQALHNRWIISILLVVQFTLGLSVVTGTVNILYNIHYLNTKSLLDFETTYLVAPNEFSDSLAFQNFQPTQVDEVYRQLEDHPDVIAYGTYYENSLFFEEADHLEDRLRRELTQSAGFPFPQIQAIAIDENYNQLLNFRVVKGQGFSEQDFQNEGHEAFPVLAGSFFKDYYEIGEFIQDQYYIIGFIEDGYIVNNNTIDIYLKTNKAVIMPMSINIYNDFHTKFNRLEYGTILQLHPDGNLDEIHDILRLETDHNEPYIVELSATHFGEQVQGHLQEDLIIEVPQLMFIAIFILFVLISIITSTLVSILIRRREFGIKLALGESTGGLFSQIVLEIFMIALMGFGFSTVYFAWTYSDLLRTSREFNSASVLDIKLDFHILFLIFLVLMAIVVIASLILYPYIKKQEPKSMIGEID